MQHNLTREPCRLYCNVDLDVCQDHTINPARPVSTLVIGLYPTCLVLFAPYVDSWLSRASMLSNFCQHFISSSYKFQIMFSPIYSIAHSPLCLPVRPLDSALQHSSLLNHGYHQGSALRPIPQIDHRQQGSEVSRGAARLHVGPTGWC